MVIVRIACFQDFNIFSSQNGFEHYNLFVIDIESFQKEVAEIYKLLAQFFIPNRFGILPSKAGMDLPYHGDECQPGEIIEEVHHANSISMPSALE